MISEKPAAKLRLLYVRLPHTISDLSNSLIYESRRIIVGISETRPSKPIEFGGKIVMNTGFQGTFFILRGKWFVVSKIRDVQGKHTGYYCDIVTPLNRSKEGILELTDLFLDLWVSPELKYKVLDEEELEQALEKSSITKLLYKKAKSELRKLVKTVKNREFPPPLVKSLEERMSL
jgi:predicted RNA-binding protein associated with RNAse of E/G family